MKNSWPICGAVLMVCLVAACARRDTSPLIVCNVNEVPQPTAFTFDSFCKTVESEHGPIEVEPNVSIKSRSLEVYFRRLDDGQLLAEQVVWVGASKHVTPAMLFGMAGTNDVGSAPGLSVVGDVPDVAVPAEAPAVPPVPAAE